MYRRKPTNIDGGMAVGRGFQPRGWKQHSGIRVNTLCQEVEGYLLQPHIAYRNAPPLTPALHTPTHPQLLTTHPRPKQHSQQQLTSDIEPAFVPRTHRKPPRTQHTIQTETALSHNSNHPRPTRKHGPTTASKTHRNHSRTEPDNTPESAVRIIASIHKLSH